MATVVMAMLHWLVVKLSFSRPRTSGDNVFVESLFEIAKYRSGFPACGGANFEAARTWCHDLVRRYNDEDRHSGIRYVTPDQHDPEQDVVILAAPNETYFLEREYNPTRWLQQTRNRSPIGPVMLNSERDVVIRDHLQAENGWLHESGNNYLNLLRGAIYIQVAQFLWHIPCGDFSREIGTIL